MPINIVPLGAGQDVGRSCILVTLNNKTIMFDCGMHMGYHDERRFPDFTYISKDLNPQAMTNSIDAVIISHFHLDHCGSLPYFTEIIGYEGPIYMSFPTKAIAPILLEDMRKIFAERKGESNFFTQADIANCMKKVTAVNVHQTITVGPDLEIKAFYAGHVLGAAMFYVRSGNESVVYTGDYNMTPDRHLGAAWIEKLKPDVLITESTYATTIRDSKRTRERDFLKKVHSCVMNGGKVLIPVFALGRAQELCILIESFWDRMNLSNIPVYFSTGLTARANEYYKLFIHWTNQAIKQTFTERNMFDFKHIKPFELDMADNPGPQVLFATPGMLHAGTSLDVFKKWCSNPKNMIILPGYCVAGTVGAKVLAGDKKIQVDKYTSIDVNLQVENLSFSAHADAKGILQLIRMCAPRNVVLVHGEKRKMNELKMRINKELGLRCFDPANGQTVRIEDTKQAEKKIHISRTLVREAIVNARKTFARKIGLEAIRVVEEDGTVEAEIAAGAISENADVKTITRISNPMASQVQPLRFVPVTGVFHMTPPQPSSSLTTNAKQSQAWQSKKHESSLRLLTRDETYNMLGMPSQFPHSITNDSVPIPFPPTIPPNQLSEFAKSKPTTKPVLLRVHRTDIDIEASFLGLVRVQALHMAHFNSDTLTDLPRKTDLPPLLIEGIGASGNRYHRKRRVSDAGDDDVADNFDAKRRGVAPSGGSVLALAAGSDSMGSLPSSMMLEDGVSTNMNSTSVLDDAMDTFAENENSMDVVSEEVSAMESLEGQGDVVDELNDPTLQSADYVEEEGENGGEDEEEEGAYEQTPEPDIAVQQQPAEPIATSLSPEQGNDNASNPSLPVSTIAERPSVATNRADAIRHTPTEPVNIGFIQQAIRIIPIETLCDALLLAVADYVQKTFVEYYESWKATKALTTGPSKINDNSIFGEDDLLSKAITKATSAYPYMSNYPIVVSLGKKEGSMNGFRELKIEGTSFRLTFLPLPVTASRVPNSPLMVQVDSTWDVEGDDVAKKVWEVCEKILVMGGGKSSAR